MSPFCRLAPWLLVLSTMVTVAAEPVDEAAEADQIMSVLMGDDVESRRNFITTNARDVRNLDF